MKQPINFFKSIGLGILLFLQFYFLYSGSLDNLIYDKAGVWIALLVILIAIPANIVAFSRSAFTRNENLQAIGMAIGMLSIITNGPYFGYWCGRHEEKCYKEYGVKTWGIVTEAFYNRGARMYYEFSVHDTLYTSFNVSNPLRHREGDSVSIVYNSRCPEMNSAIENCEK